jgi:septum formation protein
MITLLKSKKKKSKLQMILIHIRLVGKTNVVYTGVVIKYGDQITKFTETAEVCFGKATPEQIQGYVDTGEPL